MSKRQTKNPFIKTIKGGLATKLVDNLTARKIINKDELLERCTIALETIAKSNDKLFRILVVTFNSPIFSERVLFQYDEYGEAIPDENGKKLHDDIKQILNEK